MIDSSASAYLSKYSNSLQILDFAVSLEWLVHGHKKELWTNDAYSHAANGSTRGSVGK
jgi:hypothetical protein